VSPNEVKRVLLACRSETSGAPESDVAAALEEVQRVPELREWWNAQQRFHSAAAESIRGVPVPENLRDRVLARTNIIHVHWWRRPAVLSVAAAIVLLLLAAGILFQQQRPRDDTLAIFRARMVGKVMRQYSMSITTNDLLQVRQHLASRQAPADFQLPQPLTELPLMGAGVLSWRDRHVAMVCLDSKRKGMLFLFVVDAASLHGLPVQPEFKPISSMNTVSWTAAGKTYVLAGNLEPEELVQLL
jgi:hypothetical protein